MQMMHLTKDWMLKTAPERGDNNGLYPLSPTKTSCRNKSRQGSWPRRQIPVWMASLDLFLMLRVTRLNKTKLKTLSNIFSLFPKRHRLPRTLPRRRPVRHPVTTGLPPTLPPNPKLQLLQLCHCQKTMLHAQSHIFLHIARHGRLSGPEPCHTLYYEDVDWLSARIDEETGEASLALATGPAKIKRCRQG